MRRGGAGVPPSNPPPDDDADEAAGQGRRGGRKAKPAAAERQRSAEEVLDDITTRHAVFTWRDLNRQLGKEIADPTVCALATDEILRGAEVIGLRETAAAPVTHYTTRTVLKAERAVLRDAAALAAHAGQRVRPAHVEDARAANRLNDEQAAAVRHATGPEGLAIIAGEAGTGKSRTLGATARGISTAAAASSAESPRRAATRRGLNSVSHPQKSWCPALP